MNRSPSLITPHSCVVQYALNYLAFSPTPSPLLTSLLLPPTQMLLKWTVFDNRFQFSPKREQMCILFRRHRHTSSRRHQMLMYSYYEFGFEILLDCGNIGNGDPSQLCVGLCNIVSFFEGLKLHASCIATYIQQVGSAASYVQSISYRRCP